MDTTDAGGLNREAVLRAVLEGAKTRREIETIAGLSKTSVARHVDELLSADFLSQEGLLPAPYKGRPSASLAPASRLGCVIGVDLGLTTHRLICFDLAGRELGRIERPSMGVDSLGALVELLIDELRSLREQSTAVLELAGVSVALAGEVVPGSEAHLTASLSVNSTSAFTEMLSTQMATRVSVDSDANMALRGEIALSPEEEPHSIALLMLSTEVGAALVRDGEIVSTRHGAPGGLGRLPVRFTPEREWRLRDLVSLNGLVETARAFGDEPFEPAAFLAGGELPPRLRGEFEVGLRAAVSSVAILLDPERIVIAGRMSAAAEPLLPSLDECLENLALSSAEVRISRAGSYAAAIGAVLTARSEAMSHIFDELRELGRS